MQKVENRMESDRETRDYGATLVVNDPLLIAYMRVHACRTPAEEMELRKTPEGRKCFLLIAKERRKEPVALRRLPRLMGQAARKTIENAIARELKT
jgi:hypothetical protein